MIKKDNVILEDNTLIFYYLDHPKVVSEFIRCIKKGLQNGITNFIINFSNVNGVFPNAVVPICGIIDLLKERGYSFDMQGMSPPIEITNLASPQIYNGSSSYIMNRVWKFNKHDDVGCIVDAYIEELRKEDRFGDGVLMSIAWSLNEVMDNVFVHSGSNTGYIMGQIHRSSKNIAFTIYDLGRGILASFKESNHRPRTAIDAITLAIKEEVTRDKKVGQGNGLFGLHSVIVQGKGILEITSSGACYHYNAGIQKNYTALPWWEWKHPGTIVDFRLNYGNNLSLEKALVFRGKEYKITNLFVEDLEDERGNCIYDVSKHVEGTGTRESAVRAKNEVINILRESKKNVVLDFTNVSVISSSFSDELIAKLLLEIGFFQFNNLIKIKGLTMEQQKILQHSIIQRLVDSLSEP